MWEKSLIFQMYFRHTSTACTLVLTKVTEYCKTSGSVLDECIKQCSQKQDCAAVKFDDVTGNGNKEYMLLANHPPCEAADVMATMMYQKYH